LGIPSRDSGCWIEFWFAVVTLVRFHILTDLWRTMKFLIAGLGNIGPEYELTRHNIGFLTLDRLADNHKIDFTTERLADKAELKYKGKQIHLVKPNTYMNLSGKAIAYWLQDLKIPKENLLVVVDEIALPFGTLRMRTKGSAAGHNGLKNIELLLGGQEYPRLRMGIGSDYAKGQQVDYVLSKFSQDEFTALPEIMDKSIEMILSFCTIGAERTMNFFNK
jgi:PTH1 family peptidyl-tRNA hydrolase